MQLELRRGPSYKPHVQPTYEAIALAVGDFLSSMSDAWFHGTVTRPLSQEEFTDNVLEQASQDLELAAFLGKAPALSSMIASMPSTNEAEGDGDEEEDDVFDLGIAMVVHDWARSQVHTLATDLVFYEVWLPLPCTRRPY